MFTIVNALKVECEPILRFLGQGMVTFLAEGTLYTYPKVHVLRVGVSGSKASKTLRAYLVGHKPEFILNIGFAGALNDAFHPCSIYKIQCVKSAYSDGIYELNVFPGLTSVFSGSLLTVREAVEEEAQKKFLFRRFQTDLVDMETFELVRVCRDFSLPIYALKVVTDLAGEQAQAQFKTHFKTCAERLFKTIQPMLPK